MHKLKTVARSFCKANPPDVSASGGFFMPLDVAPRLCDFACDELRPVETLRRFLHLRPCV